MDTKGIKNALDKLPPTISESERMQRFGKSALAALSQFSNSDIESLMMAMNEARADTATPRDVLYGNRFNKPSPVNVRRLHEIEGLFFDELPDINFVDISPLQPMGLSTLLTETSEKKIISATRNSEVNADPTNALFRLAYMDLKDMDANDSSVVHLATNSRTARAQNFGKGSKLLPHFKSFSEVSVGFQSQRYGELELETLLSHLESELSVIEKIIPEDKVSVNISNTVFSRELSKNGALDVDNLTKNMRNYSKDDYQDREPFIIRDYDSVVSEMHDNGVLSGYRVFDLFSEIVRDKFPQLVDKLQIDTERVAGINYYKHLCYKIIGFTSSGEPVPLADGGTTDWAQRVGGRKGIFTVASGVGTELLSRYFEEEKDEK